MGYIYRVTDSPLIHTDRIEDDASNNSLVIARIPWRKNVYAEPLRSNDREIHKQTHRLMGGIYEVRPWYGLSCHGFVSWRLKAGTWASARQRFAKHIPMATRNRPLLDNGLVNTHSRGKGYADYNRRNVRPGIFYSGRLVVIKGSGFVNSRSTRVEAGSNTSTVTLRVVGGDEKGSLESETVKYGHESYGTRTRKWLRWRGPAGIVNDRPGLSLERAPEINKHAIVRQK
jgi:hypothetical protein